MMNRFVMLLLAMVAMLALGCSDKPTKEAEDLPKFSLSFTSPDANLPKVLAKLLVATTDTVDFEMGILTGTNEYPFLLSNNSKDPNTGLTVPLRNIVVSSTNPKFVPSPKEILSLGAPKDTLGASTLVQILARHGLAESGTGAMIDLITEEDDTTTITISGDFGDTTFAVTYTMRVTPAYVKFAPFTGNGLEHNGAVGVNCPMYFKDPVTQEFVTRDTLPEKVFPVFYECVGNTPYVLSAESKVVVEDN